MRCTKAKRMQDVKLEGEDHKALKSIVWKLKHLYTLKQEQLNNEKSQFNRFTAALQALNSVMTSTS